MKILEKIKVDEIPKDCFHCRFGERDDVIEQYLCLLSLKYMDGITKRASHCLLEYKKINRCPVCGEYKFKQVSEEKIQCLSCNSISNDMSKCF